jgi:drug/metabolite transporter (DMT)-like permease
VRRYGILMVILGSVLWGTDSLFRRPLAQDLSAITIVFLEHCVLSIVLLPSLLASRREVQRLGWKEWISLIFIAVGGSVAATSLFTFSIKYGNPSVTVLLQKTQPVFATLLARWSLGEKPGRWFWYGFGPAIAGAYLVSAPEWPSIVSFGSGGSASVLAALGASMLWGMSTVFGRYVAGRLSVPVITGLRFVVALPVLALLYFTQPPGEQALPHSVGSASSIIAMALIPGLAALVLYYKGLKSTIAPMASIGELAFPVTAVAVNWIFLGSRLTGLQGAGALLLIASMTTLTYSNTTETEAGRLHPDALKTL